MSSTVQSGVKERKELNESKEGVHVSEAIITEDEYNSYFRPQYPTIKDTIQIKNKKNVGPLIPTINETVLIDKPCSKVSKQPNDCLKKILNTSVENQKTIKNTNDTDTKLYIEKKRKETFEKHKLELLEKKRLAEERKIRLDNLRKTTRELAKASVKQKTPRVKENNKIINVPTESNKPEEVDQTFRLSPKVRSFKKIPKNPIENNKIINVPTESNKPEEVDQTFRLSPKVESFKKISKNPINLSKKCKKDLEMIYDDNECLKMTENIKNTSTFVKISKNENVIPQEKKPQLRDVTKPEDLFSRLKINDDYKLIDNSLFDFLMPKIVNVDTSLTQKDHNNEQLVEEKTEKEKDSVEMSQDTDLQLIDDTKMSTGLDLSKSSHEEIIKNIRDLQELVINQHLPSKVYYSESTQTDDCNNLLSLFTPKKLPPPPMNFISVLKCKNRLQLTRQNYFNSYQPIESLNTNNYSISNNLHSDKIININNVEYTVQNNLVDYNKNEYGNDKKQKNDCNESKSRLVKETIVSECVDLTLNETLKNNNFEGKTKCSTLNNDKLFTESKNSIIKDDVKQVLKNINSEFEFLTKDIYKDTNDLHSTCTYLKFGENNSIFKSSSCFPEIHDEFQAELETLDQLNNSLCDIENMSCDMSIKSNEQFVDNELSNHSTSAGLNFKSLSNKPTSFSKLNAVSSNRMCVDKAVIGFSIQMFEQLIKDEELRAKQHQTIILLREKSLTNRLKWEITMYDLQTRHLKNGPGYVKQLQLLKQKHRGEVKKLEHSLYQVKRLGREINSIYTRRLIVLKEHIQHLKTQSSSKKVIRKLKNLDQVAKKEEFRSLNTDFLKQSDKTDCVDTVESECVKINLNEFITSKNKIISPTTFEVDKSEIILRNQANSPINIGTKQVKNVKIQTENKGSLPCTKNKCVQTSKPHLYDVSSNNIKSVDLLYEYKSTNEIPITVDKTSLSSNLSTSHAEPMQTSESSVSTVSEQSDMNVRILILQNQLEARKVESFKLKKERKKLRLDNLKNLKTKEQNLLKQIDLYDKKIEESKRSLINEIERKSILQKKCPIKFDSSKYLSESNHRSEENNQNLHELDNKTWIDEKQYFYPIAMEKSNNQDIISQENPPYKLQQTVVIKPKQNVNEFENNCDLVQTDHCKPRNQSLETNQCCSVVTLPKECTDREVEILRESSEIDNNVNSILLNPDSVETLIYTSNDKEENLKKKSLTEEINEIPVINLEEALCNNCISNKEMSNTSNNQGFSFGEKISIENLTISNSHTITSSSNSSNIQRKLSIDSNEDGIIVCEKNENDVDQLDALSSEIGVDDNYSTDFISDDNTSKFQGSYQFHKSEDNTIEFLDEERSNESSYEEERSEGDVMFEDKICIEHYSNESNFVQNERSIENEVNVITNNIFNCLLNDAKKILKSDLSEALFFSKKNNLNNLTEKTPLLMNLKHKEKHQNMIFLFEQATTISDVLFKRHLQQLPSETLQVYLPKLNELQKEKLSLYLNWSSHRKRLKLPEYLNYQHESSDVDNDESFEMFYQEYKNQKKYPTFRDESNNEMLNQTKQETKKLKLEQMRVEEEIKRLRISEKSKLFLQKIPNEPPPPYKSPTKKEAFVDIPYTPDETYKIVLAAASQLFNDFQSPMSEDYILDTDSSSHANYKTLIFDYCKDVAQNIFIDNNKVPVWKRHIKMLKHFRAKPKSPKDLCDIVMKEINQILDTDDCEEKVNKFVVKQLHEEDSEWTDIRMDAMDVQDDIIKNLMKKLIHDTMTNIEKNFYLKFIS